MRWGRRLKSVMPGLFKPLLTQGCTGPALPVLTSMEVGIFRREFVSVFAVGSLSNWNKTLATLSRVAGIFFHSMAFGTALNSFFPRMAAEAKSSASKPSRCMSSSHVLCVSNRFKMGWVDTGRNSAQVVKRESLRNRPENEFVRVAMGKILPFRGWPELAIAMTVTRTSPQPATVCFDNFGKEAFLSTFHDSIMPESVL